MTHAINSERARVRVCVFKTTTDICFLLHPGTYSMMLDKGVPTHTQIISYENHIEQYEVDF